MPNKITFITDVEKKQIKVTFSPKLEESKLGDREQHLNSILSGTHISLAILLQDVPILRAATEIERVNNIYVYVDQEKDNDLYRVRKNLRDVIAKSFEETLRATFPDIFYIEAMREYNQELLTDLSPEESKEYTERIKEVTEYVKENPYDVPKKEKEVDSKSETFGNA